MPGPRTGNRRIVHLREIGYRLLAPRGNYMTNTEAAPGAAPAITWISCQLGKQTNPEKPKAAVQPKYIQRSAITFVRNPNYTEFSNPCSKFE